MTFGSDVDVEFASQLGLQSAVFVGSFAMQLRRAPDCCANILEVLVPLALVVAVEIRIVERQRPIGSFSRFFVIRRF